MYSKNISSLKAFQQGARHSTVAHIDLNPDGDPLKQFEVVCTQQSQLN